MPLLHLGHLLVIVVDSLTAGGDLQAVEQQVIAQGVPRIFRIIHSIERAFYARIMGNEHQWAAGLLQEVLAQPLFFFRRQIHRIGDLLAGFLRIQLLGIGKFDLRHLVQLRQPAACPQHQIQLCRVFRIQQMEDVPEHAGLQFHQILETFDEAHLQIQALEFRQMARRVGVFTAEHRSHSKDLLENAHHGLLVLLRALVQIGTLVEILDHEHIGTAFRAAHNHLRRYEFGESLFPQELTEAVHDAVSHPHDGTDPRVPQGHHPVVQQGLQLQVFHLSVVADLQRQLFGCTSHLFHRENSDIKSQRTSFIHCDGAVDQNPVLRTQLLCRIGGLPDALEGSAGRTDDDEGEVAHILDPVHGTANLHPIPVLQTAVCKLLYHNLNVPHLAGPVILYKIHFLSPSNYQISIIFSQFLLLPACSPAPGWPCPSASSCTVR